MNPGSRLASLLAGDAVESPVVIPMVAANHAARLAGVKLCRVITEAAALAEVLHVAYLRYRCDGIVVFADTLVEAEAMGCRIEIPDDNDPFLVEPPGAASLEPADPERDGRMPVILETIRRLKDLTAGEVPILGSLKGPFSLASFLAGPDVFLASLLECPSLAKDLLAVATNNQRRYLAAIVRAGGLPFIGDPVASGSIISPVAFREFAFPGLCRLVGDAHLLGVQAGIHICGDTTQVLRQLRETKADFVSIDDIDLAGARLESGADAVIMGNVSTRLLLEGSAEEVREAAEHCLETGLPNLILSSACDVPTEAPAGNVHALVQAARDWTGN